MHTHFSVHTFTHTSTHMSTQLSTRTSTHLIFTRVRTCLYAHTPRRSTGGCVTKEGPACVFPTVYKGKSHGSKCIAQGHDSLWCYTAKKGAWGHCPSTAACTGAAQTDRRC